MSVIFYFIFILAQVLTFAIFLRAILSWFALGPGNPLITLLDQITEPVLAPLRRVVPRLGMFDLVPLVAIILLQSVVVPAAQRLL